MLAEQIEQYQQIAQERVRQIAHHKSRYAATMVWFILVFAKWSAKHVPKIVLMQLR